MTVYSKAEVEMLFSSPSLAEKAYVALKPEEASPGKERSIVKFLRRGRILKLEIRARDTPSLRAALNSLLRLVAVVRDMIELKEEERWRNSPRN
ncbi:MAG: KEOPS complex subunit Pcc1 [Candidatus Hadarchaeales archaeon]